MPLQPQIQVRNRKTGHKSLYRLDQNSMIVGRDLASYIILESRTISRRHAEILQEGSQFFVRDLKSDNGTSLNERRLSPSEKNLLRSGDTIQIDDYDLLFYIPSSSESGDIYETTDTDFLEIKMVKNLIRALDRDQAPTLEIVEGPKAGTRFILDGKSQDVVIGRDPACEFMIDSEVISRKHARIEKRFDMITIRDLESKNGLYVNRERTGERRLKDGDIILLGTLALAFRNPNELSFDLEPPRLKKEEGPKPSPKDPDTGPIDIAAEPLSRATGPLTRYSSRPEGGAALRSPQQPTRSAVDDLLQILKTVKMPFHFKLNFSEILTALIALAVLAGSIWGIWKVLK